MRIEPTNPMQPQDAGAAGKASQEPLRSPSRPEVRQAGLDAETQALLAPYLQAAREAEDVDEKAIAEARKLLESGQLDTPEAARRLAEALLRLGI